MKKALIILFILISNAIFSQNFAPVGAKWHYKKFCPTPDWYNDCGFFTAEAVRDTMINGSLSTIIEYKDTGVIISNAQMIIKEDSNRVYFYENNQFKLLYDYNLNSGDTMIFKVPYNWYYYDVSCYSYPDTSKTARVIIDSTKQLIISGQSLKALYTTNIYIPLDTNYNNWWLGEIIERIGSTSGLFGYPTVQCTAGFSGHFRCYSDSLINYKPIIEDCDYITGIENLQNQKNAIIFPNPTSAHFTIEGLNKPYNLTVYNTVGQLLYQENDVKESNKKIDVSNYAKGILFIRIEGEGEVIYQKVVRQ